MRKSKYGKDLTFFLEPESPLLGCNQVFMHEVYSTFRLPLEAQREIEEKWNRKSGGKRPIQEEEWRYESYEFDVNKNLHLFVSPTYYVWHNILRDTKGMPQSFYPTPITANSIQVTSDGFIPIAVRKTKITGEKTEGYSDQTGLCLLGSGFFGRFVNNEGRNLPPRSPFSVVYSECREEEAYDLPCPESAFYIGDAKFLGLSVGSNTDMTAYVHIPLKVPHTKLRLNPESKEHSDLWFLSTDVDSLSKFLREGGMNGGVAADHCIGGIEQYLLHAKELSK
jgi:hypothetical protein